MSLKPSGSPRLGGYVDRVRRRRGPDPVRRPLYARGPTLSASLSRGPADLEAIARPRRRAQDGRAGRGFLVRVGVETGVAVLAAPRGWADRVRRDGRRAEHGQALEAAAEPGSCSRGAHLRARRGGLRGATARAVAQGQGGVVLGSSPTGGHRVAAGGLPARSPPWSAASATGGAGRGATRLLDSQGGGIAGR